MAFLSPNTEGGKSAICSVLTTDSEKHRFQHDCSTGGGTAGSLIISAIDDAPLGIHFGRDFNLDVGFAATLSDAFEEIEELTALGEGERR